MMIVMRDGVSDDQVNEVIEKLHSIGAEAHVSRGEFKTIIGAIGDRERISEIPFAALPGVEAVIPVMKPYKLVSREFHPEGHRGRSGTGRAGRCHLRGDRGTLRGGERGADASPRPGPRRRRAPIF